MTEPLTSAPVLETERLTLRGPLQSDLAEFTRFLTSSPRMQAQGETGSKEEAWFGFLIGIGHWQWHGFGFFTLVERGQGLPIGRVGLLKHSSWPEVELAWHLFEGAEGKGYATEAGQAVRSWAYQTHGFNQLVSYIDCDNHRSQAVAKRLRAKTDGTRADHDPEAEVWKHLPEPI
ncbi:RimJ/RimL family protein N-acetyltransferase [Litoreibacter halocynthiae]|uniref:RimJ/RimL family protein N-acetyltransferase n=1 Tax=Litoreibacter halocynthiae TaxID=1242689 RepID=A0A4R7LQF4_9RHOB|nr:GNAT family N-acetyltransferase [Litoreibacter halocynthiae]TDT78064.1 RimJ/RimL family protein N-acetyltransferase [Litoreibacter halocynthiae]